MNFGIVISCYILIIIIIIVIITLGTSFPKALEIVKKEKNRELGAVSRLSTSHFHINIVK